MVLQKHCSVFGHQAVFGGGAGVAVGVAVAVCFGGNGLGHRCRSGNCDVSGSG